MNNIKMIVAYDGAGYKGWQKQDNTKNTIQEVMEDCIKEVFDQKIELVASGRTDAGVHALAQCVHFQVKDNPYTEAEIQKKINKLLPNAIVIKSISFEDERFHARYNTKSKLYKYRILNDPVHDPFRRKYVNHIDKPLDLYKMGKASELFLGEHDFSAFTSDKGKKKSKVRTIYSIEIKKEGKEIVLYFHGDGFLYNMVRIITGTLVEVGLGKLDIEDVSEILESKERKKAGYTVPPHGLYLVKVEY